MTKIALLVTIGSLLLVGCGSKEPEAAAPASTPTTAESSAPAPAVTPGVAAGQGMTSPSAVNPGAPAPPTPGASSGQPAPNPGDSTNQGVRAINPSDTGQM